MALADLSQADYFAQNPNAGFGDYLNYAQGKTAGGEFQAPNASSLPPGFMQSEYGPAWQSVLAQFNDPNYNRNEDPNNLHAWLRNAPIQFNAGRSLAEFTAPTSEANLIGGGRFGLSPATVGQLALGGFGGAAMGAGVGSTGSGVAADSTVVGGVGGAGEGSVSTAATGVTPAATAGIGGGDTGLMAGATTGASAPLSAAQDPLGSGGDPGNATAGSSSGRAGAGTAMSRILDGTASTVDWLSFGGNLASTGLGVAGSRNAVNAFRDLNDRYMAIGAPSRGRYEASMTPGFDPSTIPGYSGAVDTASKGILARLAATGGNPWGNPGGLIEANKQIISGTALPAIQDYQRLNAGTGGYAGFNAAAPGAATAGIGANAGVYNAVGSGLAGLLNPQPSLLDTLRGLGVQGLS